MKRAIEALSLVLIFLMFSSGSARAGTSTFDKAMQPIVKQYLKIHKALADDTTKGVAGAAKKITRLTAKVDVKTVKGEHAGHYKDLPKKIKTAAIALSKIKGLKEQREAFKPLSRPLVMWATMSKPDGINVVFCSMAKGSWLQTDKVIANPYYGSQMLRCGEVVSGKDKGTAGGHMKHGHGH